MPPCPPDALTIESGGYAFPRVKSCWTCTMEELSSVSAANKSAGEVLDVDDKDGFGEASETAKRLLGASRRLFPHPLLGSSRAIASPYAPRGLHERCLQLVLSSDDEDLQ